METRRYRLKFYADGEGAQNKLFSFAVSDGRRAALLLERFLFTGWRLRAVFMEDLRRGENGRVVDLLIRVLSHPVRLPGLHLLKNSTVTPGQRHWLSKYP
jgi:hypothetical protein